MEHRNEHRTSRRVGMVLVGAAATALLLAAVAVPAGAITLPPYNTTVTLTTTSLTAFTGQSVTFTGKAVSIGHGTPVGQMSFAITGTDASTVTCDGGSNDIAMTSGVGACVVSGGLRVASAPYTVTVTYTDTVDTNYKPGTATKIQAVKQGRTTTTVTSSAAPAVTGEPVTLTAALAPIAPATGSPTGSVTFTGVTCDGGTNTIAVSGGLAQCSIAAGLVALSTGYPVTATYTGDSEFLTSAGAVKQLVKPASATVSLVPNPNTCSGSLCTVPQAVAVSFTATVATNGTDGGTGTPSGNLTFSITPPGSSSSVKCDGGVNTFALVAGQATCTIAAGLPSSIYFKITATLSSTQYAASSTTIFENSMMASTTTTTSITKNIKAGQTFTVTAVVAPTAGYVGTSTLSGFVNFLVCGANSNGFNGCQGGASSVDGTGTATFLIGGGEYPGVYTYSAIYSGDQNFYGSTARSKSFNVVKAPTQLILTESGGFSSYDGDAVAITATVAVPSGGAGSTLVGPPTGTVTFAITGPNGPVSCADGNTVSLPIDPGQVEGSVTCFLPPGTLTNSTPPATTYSVQVNYSGDSDYVISGAHANQIVVPLLA